MYESVSPISWSRAISAVVRFVGSRTLNVVVLSSPDGPGNNTVPTCVCNSLRESLTFWAAVSSEPTVRLPVISVVPAIIVLPFDSSTLNVALV